MASMLVINDANVTGIEKISRSHLWRLVGESIDWILFLLTFICVRWDWSSRSEWKCLSHRFDLRTSLCHDERLCSLQSVPQPFVSRSSLHKMPMIVSGNSMMSKIKTDCSTLFIQTTINSSHAFRKRQVPIPSSCNRSQRIWILRQGCRRVLSVLSPIILATNTLASVYSASQFGVSWLRCRIDVTLPNLNKSVRKPNEKREGSRSVDTLDSHDLIVISFHNVNPLYRRAAIK